MLASRHTVYCGISSTICCGCGGGVRVGGGVAVASVAHVFGGNVRVEVGDEVAFPVFFVKIAVGGKFVNE